jgi:hypothetical protein
MLLCEVDQAEDLRALLSAQLECVTTERDEALKALAHADMGHMRRVCERDEARAERDEAVRLRDQLLDREKDYLYDIEKAEKERDEARDALNRKGKSCAPDLDMMRLLARAERAKAAHDLMAAEKERAEHAHNELVLSLPTMLRDMAERQREALERVTKERDAARAEIAALTGELTPEAHRRLSAVRDYILSGGPLPGAERQREACAETVFLTEFRRAVLATPLVTDGGES